MDSKENFKALEETSFKLRESFCKFKESFFNKKYLKLLYQYEVLICNLRGEWWALYLELQQKEKIIKSMWDTQQRLRERLEEMNEIMQIEKET